MQGQSLTDYNRKGDEAMEKGDFFGAQVFYDQGLSTCDFQSISKITEIWNLQPALRRGMNSIISKCFNCLNTLAETHKDTRAMQLLIDYYTQGIGIEKDSIKAGYWRKEVGMIFGITDVTTNTNLIKDTVYIPQSNPNLILNGGTQPPKTNLLERHNAFIAYTFSPTMPIGFTLGGFNRLGFSFSVKASLKHPDNRYECNQEGVINYSGVCEFNQHKWHSLMTTASVLFPFFSDRFCIAVGGGFGKRDLYREITEYDVKTAEPTGTAWCYDTYRSYKGIAAELGVMYRYKHVLFTGGVNSVSFKDFDGYIGLGYSF